jgi:hypothetical protein
MTIGGFPKNAGRFATRPEPVVETPAAALSPRIEAEPAEIDYSDEDEDWSGDAASVQTQWAPRVAGVTIEAEPAEIDYSDEDEDEPETASGSGDASAVHAPSASQIVAAPTIEAEPVEVDYSDYEDEPETDSEADGSGSEDDESDVGEAPEDPDNAPIITKPLAPPPRYEPTIIPPEPPIRGAAPKPREPLEFGPDGRVKMAGFRPRG